MISAFRPYWTHRELLANLVLRELRTRYRRSAIGWLWALINPLMTAFVYYVVFRFVFRATPSPGNPSGNTSFVFFLLAGTMPWTLLASGVTGGIGSILGAGTLITRVYFPRELIPAANVISMTVSLAVELCLLLVIQIPFGWIAIQYVPVVALLVVLQALFVTGLALWLAALNVRYRDVQHLVGVGIMMCFYLTPILYDVSYIPERASVLGMHNFPLRDVLLANPMSRFVMAYRNCIYDGRLPGAETMLACGLFAVGSFWMGSTYFRARSRRFAEEL